MHATARAATLRASRSLALQNAARKATANVSIGLGFVIRGNLPGSCCTVCTNSAVCTKKGSGSSPTGKYLVSGAPPPPPVLSWSEELVSQERENGTSGKIIGNAVFGTV